MSQRRRLRRKDPERTEPIRDWSNLYRQADSWPPRSPLNDPASDDGVHDGRSRDGVTHGVELGYRVIEEQLRQGQAAARHLNSRGPAPGAASRNDLGKIVERLLRYYTDLVPMWADLVNSVAASAPQRAAAYPGANNGASAEAGGAVSVEIASARPARVTLDLRPHAARLGLVTHGLRAMDAAKPPLTDISFEPARDNGRGCLRVRVPDAQPSDIYTGVLIDRDSGEPCGTLSVRIAE